MEWVMGRDNEPLFLVTGRATAWSDIWDTPKEGNERGPL